MPIAPANMNECLHGFPKGKCPNDKCEYSPPKLNYIDLYSMDGNEVITCVDVSDMTDVWPEVIIWGSRTFIPCDRFGHGSGARCGGYREAKTVTVD